MSKPLFYHIKLLSALLFFALGAHAVDVKDFTFSHLGKAEGLDNQRIFSICPTSDGALWWSSKTGVERYNGSQVAHYRLEHNVLFEHQGGRTIRLTADSIHLYAFDNRGSIFLYNEVQDRFDMVMSLSAKIGHEVALNDLYIGTDGLLLAMHDGIFLLRDTLLTSLHQGVWVNRILQVKGRPLYCTRDGVLNSEFKRLLPYNVESGYYDETSGRLWLGGYESGLNIVTLDAQNRVTADEFVRLGCSSQPYPIRSIVPYDASTMLVGIDGLGVYQLPRQGAHDGGRLLFNANEGSHGVLHGNGIYSIVVDEWRNIVMGSYAGGIDIARPVGSTTAILQYEAGNEQSLVNEHVNTVLQLDDHQLLMGTDNGISIWNSQTNHWSHSCQGVVVLHAHRTPDGRILLSTYGKGVYELDAQGHARQLYTVAGGVLRDDHVYATCCDRDGSVWMGCLNGDLVQQSASQRYYYPVDNVQTMMQLPSGQMAVGTAFGLKLVDPVTHHVDTVNYAPEGARDVNTFITHLLLADERHLWIATDGGGIYVYDLRQHESIQLSETQGLPSNFVSSLARDDDGRLWVATEEGLAFVVQQADTMQVVNVNYCYGLNREYSRAAVCELSDGDVLFGTTTGAVIIHPRNLQAINYTAHLRILRVLCNDTPEALFNEQVQKMLSRDELWLKYGQRTFTLFFESINMRNHFDIVYRYRLGGGAWSQLSTQQFIRFANLEPGRHELTIQAVSRTSHTVLDEQQLTIIISQPWWNSWWMWAVYILLVFLLFFGAWQVYKLHERYMRLTIDYLQLSGHEPIEDGASAASGDNVDAAPAEEVPDGEGGKDFVDKATRLIAEHLSDTNFTIDQLCREMAMSRTLFYVRLKSYTGKSPQDFIRIIRLERAAALLRSGHSVTDAAALTGFDNPKYFSTVFKKYFDVSPSKYS